MTLRPRKNHIGPIFSDFTLKRYYEYCEKRNFDVSPKVQDLVTQRLKLLPSNSLKKNPKLDSDKISRLAEMVSDRFNSQEVETLIARAGQLGEFYTATVILDGVIRGNTSLATGTIVRQLSGLLDNPNYG